MTLLADINLPPLSGFSDSFFQSAGNNPESRIALFISNIITVLTIFGGLAFLFWFIIGALQWASSGGDPKQLDKAKSQMSTAIAGLFVLIISSGIFFILSQVTGLDLLNFENLVRLLRP